MAFRKSSDQIPERDPMGGILYRPEVVLYCGHRQNRHPKLSEVGCLEKDFQRWAEEADLLEW